MLRASADVRETGLFQHALDRHLVEIDSVARQNDAPEIDATPAYDDIGLGIQPGFE
jgi:hypothetical protein